ncbi:M56 family metallopeptidase [Belliella kenyensis]|uniref:M56 family metallopeptidase n=1 Tax=Belliella kenyensis TaxID=1472724 RepID=A0ABV8EP43_9BACT|nr:M56 family metallopeptidase [Belliella kenyensis]MCH7402850.1 M48 family metalloprotease [Belliella kenyensis]MDN3602556.1 M56 family metallopeptidase [Belliella kenyensis]
MNWINELLPPAYLYAIGWMLIHAIWQVAGIGLVLWFLLRYSSQKSSAYKYNLGISSLLLMLVISFFTFGYYLDLDSQSFEHSMVNTTQYISADTSDLKAELISYVNEEPSSRYWLVSLLEHIERNIPILVNIWMIGVVLFMIKFASAMADLKTLRSRPSKPIAHKWENKVDEYVKKLKIDRSIQILESKFISIPLTYGILKPIILIPTGLLFQLNNAQVEAIIAHELAHIKRQDYLINLLQSTMEIFFFFHPVFWWINGLIRTERENACDDIAIQLGVAPRALAEALVTCTNYSMAANPQLSMAATSRKTPTLDRIKRIMGFNTPNKPTSTLSSLTMTISLILSTSLLLGAQAIKTPVNDLDHFLTEIKSEIILMDNFWQQFETNPELDLSSKTEVMAHTLKITPLEFEGVDFSDMPIKNLDQKIGLPIVSFDAKIDTTTSMVRVQETSVNLNKNTFEPRVSALAGNPTVNVSSNTESTTSVRGATLTQQAFGQNYARVLASLSTKAAKGSEFPRTTGVPTARGIYNIDTTKSYKKELKEATSQLSNAKTEDERNVAIQKITEISEKIASSTSQQWVKNDSVMLEFSRRSAEAIGPWMEENSKQMEEWQNKLEPIMKSFSEKMEGLNEKLMPLNDELQSNFKKFDEESRPWMEEFQLKIAEWQKENQPKIEEFQKKMAEWQIEYATKMKELQKEFKEKKNSPDK